MLPSCMKRYMSSPPPQVLVQALYPNGKNFQPSVAALLQSKNVRTTDDKISPSYLKQLQYPQNMGPNPNDEIYSLDQVIHL